MPYRLDTALNVGLENDIQFLDLTGTDLVVKVIQVDRLRRKSGRYETYTK